MSERKKNNMAIADEDSGTHLKRFMTAIALLASVAIAVVYFAAAGQAQAERGQGNISASPMAEDGKQIFRFDTFGDEAFWGDALKLHRAIEGPNLEVSDLGSALKRPLQSA